MCVCKCTHAMKCPWRSEEGDGSPHAEIMDRWLLAALWVPGIQPRSCARAPSALKH